jgi:ankyrin repeat protein
MLAVSLACGAAPQVQALCDAVDAANVDDVKRLLAENQIDLNDDSGFFDACRPFPHAIGRVASDRARLNDRDLQIVRVMLDHGANPNGCWKNRRSGSSSSGAAAATCVLTYGASQGSAALMRLLLERGANARSGAGAAAAARAAGLGELEVVKLLVEAGAPLGEVGASGDDPGSTRLALGEAVAGLHPDVVAYLDAQPGAPEFRRSPPGFVDALPGQRSLDAAERAAMTAARRGDIPALRDALTKGVPLDRLDDFGLTMLMRAAAFASPATVDVLLGAGADVNLMNGGRSALHVAASLGRVEVIENLVRGGADVNLRGSDQQATALFAAVQANQAGAVRALLASGADPTLGEGQESPLAYAERHRLTAVVGVLRERLSR